MLGNRAAVSGGPHHRSVALSRCERICLLVLLNANGQIRNSRRPSQNWLFFQKSA